MWRENIFSEVIITPNFYTYDPQGRMSATIVPWPERALKLRIEVNTSLVIKLGPWTDYGTSILFMP